MLASFESTRLELVSQIFTSWNPLISWLRNVEVQGLGRPCGTRLQRKIDDLVKKKSEAAVFVQ